MARFKHNIWSKSRGSIGGITFSLARDRKGKLQTGRERVAPANPDTPPQQAIRGNMGDSLMIYEGMNLAGHPAAFERAVEELPAYQSILSIYTRAKTFNPSNNNLTVTNVPRSIPRGAGLSFRITNVQPADIVTYSFFLSNVVGSLPDNPQLVTGVIPYLQVQPELWFQRFTAFSQPFTGSGTYLVPTDEFEEEGYEGALFYAFLAPPGSMTPWEISNIQWGFSDQTIT